MFIGDVGQERREEVNVVSPRRAPVNFGWPCLEGTFVFDESEACLEPTPPLYEYAHGPDSCSITGGISSTLGTVGGAVFRVDPA